MRSYFVPTIAVAMILSGILSARSDDIPTLDVRPVCRGIASQSELDVGLQQTNFEQCVQSEQATRVEIKKEWSTFSAADKSHCVALAKNFNGVQNGVTNGSVVSRKSRLQPGPTNALRNQPGTGPNENWNHTIRGLAVGGGSKAAQHSQTLGNHSALT